jgi:hypothetical protein
MAAHYAPEIAETMFPGEGRLRKLSLKDEGGRMIDRLGQLLSTRPHKPA